MEDHAVCPDVEDALIEQECFHDDIDAIQEHGINAADIQKLKSSGIATVKGLQMQTKKTLIQIKGLSEAKIEKIRDAAKKISKTGFMTAADLRIKRESVVRCSTGSSDLDALLGGGIPSQQITEVFGEFRTGKSQLCHTMCITAQLPASLGGMEGKVAYIDTEGTFRPERLMPIADRFGVDRDAVLDNIMYARAYTSEHQMELLSLCAAKFAEERGTFKLLIVDSIIALFRVDYSGRGELADRQQKLAHMLSCLVKLAEEFNVAVFITNQMTADPGANVTFVADPKKPVGGHILAHSSTLRLSLRKGRGDQRICKIYDSPDMPESEAVYQITNGGIDNPTS